MNTCKNATRGGGALASRKLLAALAVLAVALVMLAAVPAVDADGTTSDTSETVPPADESEKGYIVDEDGNWTITSVEGMFAFAKVINDKSDHFVGRTVTLKNNIDFKGAEWEPIGTTVNGAGGGFGGTFDGNGKTVSNFRTIVPESVDTKNFATGLFGFCDILDDQQNVVAVIKDLTICGAVINSSHYAGALAGYFSGTIENCHVVDSKITSTHVDDDNCGDKAGALIGYLNNPGSSVIDCSAKDCSVIAERDAGQLIGKAQEQLIGGCYATNVKVSSVEDSVCKSNGQNINEKLVGKDIECKYSSAFIEDSEGNKTYIYEDTEIEVKDNGKTTFKGDGEMPDATVGKNGTYVIDGSVTGNITFTGEGASAKFQKGETYSGTVKFGDENIIVFSGVEFTSDTTVTAGSVEIEGGFTSTAGGSIVIYGEAKLIGNVTIGYGVTFTIDSGATLEIPKGKTLTFESGSKLVNNGSIGGAGKLVIESGAYYEGNENLNVVTEADSSSLPTAYIGGEVDGANFDKTQRIEVIQDTTIIGTLDVTGVLHVPAGVTLTVKAGGSLVIAGVYDSIIEGTLVIEEAEEDDAGDLKNASLKVSTTGSFEVSGSLVVADELEVTGQAMKVTGTGSVMIESTGTVKGKIDVAEDASLSIEGAVSDEDSDFTIAGKLEFNSDVLSTKFNVEMTGNAVVDIQKLALKNGASVEISDLGTVIYNEKNKAPESDQTGVRGQNSLTITVKVDPDDVDADTTASLTNHDWKYGVQIYGLTVAVTETASKITKNDELYGSNYENKYKHVSVMSVSGSVSLEGVEEFIGDDETASSDADENKYTMGLELVGKTSAVVSDSLKLGIGIDAVFAGYVSIDAPVTLSYSATDEDSSTLTFGKAGVSDEIVINAVVDATAASYSVKNSVTVNDDTRDSITVAAGGSILLKDNELDKTIGLNAAYYCIVVPATTTTPRIVTHCYVTVDAALPVIGDADKKTVTVYGEQSVTASATVPAKAKLVLDDGATLNVGVDEEDIDIVLTIADGAGFSGGETIKVNGTLHIDKSSDAKNQSKIKSDVVSKELDVKTNKPVSNGWVEYTNLATALAKAASGQVITLKDGVTLSVSTTIPEGVTLDVAANTLIVACAVTLTVDGTLDITEGKLAIANKYVASEGAAYNKDAGKLVLNGFIAYTDEASIVTADYDGDEYDVNTDTFTVAGAYYSIDGDEYISTVANAAVRLTDTDDGIMIKAAANNKYTKDSVQFETSMSTSVEFSNVAFDGDADEPATVTIACKVVATGVLLSNVEVVFTSASKSTFEASDATGSISIKGEIGAGTKITSMSYSEDEAPVLGFTGKVTDYDSNSKSVATHVSFDGTVYLFAGTDISTDAVDITGNVSVVKTVDSTSVTLGGETKNLGDKPVASIVSVIGTLTVKDGVNVKADTENVQTLVSGNLVVSGEGSAFSADTLTVSGTVDATATNETTLKYKGSVTAKTLYIGVDGNIESKEDVAKTVFTPTASVLGNVKVTGYAVKAAGATAPTGWTASDSAHPVGSSTLKLKSTVLLKEAQTTGADNEYVTLYALSTSTDKKHIADFFIDATDSEFEGWMNADDVVAKRTGDGTTTPPYSYNPDDAIIGADGWTTASAKIDYAIYALKIITDGGIGYVTVDGILMSAADNTFTATGLKAGQHTIGISAASGYDVSKVVLINMDGTAVGSMTVTMSGKDSSTYKPVSTETGTSSYYLSTYQLVGSETAAPSGGSSSGGSDFSGIIDAIDKNTEAVKNQENGGSSDSSLTDILLIVLVILIVIMAALVAMRMMRS